MLKQALLKWLCVIFLISGLRCSNSIRQPHPRAVHPAIPPADPDKLHPKPRNEESLWNPNVNEFKDNECKELEFSDEEMKKFKLWSNAVVPYYIDVRSYSDKVLRDRIRSFLNVVNSLTVLKFTELPSPPKDDTTRWVFFINRRGLLGCADHSMKNFTTEGVQAVSLGYDCMSTGGELAEAVLAIAGVPPQHNAPNRDDFITVLTDNILPDKKNLFDKVKDDEWLFSEVDYDFFSAGHYEYYKYTANGHATIVTQNKYAGAPIGEATSLSKGDICKIRKMYGKISSRKHDQSPMCSKLFVRNPTSRPCNEGIQPEMKPEKLTGPPLQKADVEKDKEPGEKSASDEKGDEEENSTTEEDNVDNKDKEVNAYDITETEIPNSEMMEPLKRVSHIQTLKQQVKHTSFKRDPLLYLSDYHTGDDDYAKKVYKNVGVQYMKFGKSDRRRGITQ